MHQTTYTRRNSLAKMGGIGGELAKGQADHLHQAGTLPTHLMSQAKPVRGQVTRPPLAAAMALSAAWL